MQEKTTIIGIDPGIERLGIAIVEKNITTLPKEKIIFSECFKTPKTLPTEKRLAMIYKRIIEVLNEYQPDIAIIEKIFFTVNQKTAIVVAESRGTVMSAIGSLDIKVMELSPTEIKESITGNGNAKKEDIARMLPKIIDIPNKTVQDDELDAIASALAGSAKLRYSQL
jgi:crossover junction endodeoxyribonuclease RuvC